MSNSHLNDLGSHICFQVASRAKERADQAALMVSFHTFHAVCTM